MSTNNPVRVLDLFSGIGAFSLGLERAGMRTVAFCEIEPFARRVLARHWPDVHIFHDVRELSAQHLSAKGLGVDLICGGFPCQDISVAGRGAGIGGERSGLWSEFARLIGEVGPRYVIIENVANLLSGADRHEWPDDRCVCGWPYRWGRLHQRGAASRQDLLSESGRGHERQGNASSSGAASSVWGQDQAVQTSVREMGTELRLGLVRSAVGDVPSGDTASPDTEAGAGILGVADADDDRWSAEDAKWLGLVDGEGQSAGACLSAAHAGTEPKGTGTGSADRMVCEACGRDMADAAARFGVSTWMGRIFSDLSKVGLHAEWHAIPASAVGAPHIRDRVWIVAYASQRDLQRRRGESDARDGCQGGETRGRQPAGSGCIADVANATSGDTPERNAGTSRRSGAAWRMESSGLGSSLADSDSGGRREQGDVGEAAGDTGAGQPRDCGALPVSGRPRLALGPGTLREWSHAATTGDGIWAAERPICRVVDGASRQLDRRKRLIGLGNSLVPQIATLIGHAIMNVETNQ